MHTIEFFSEHGGTVAWTPGEMVQESWSHLSPEEFDRLREELKELFGSFFNTASGFMLIDELDARSGFMQMYSDHLALFFRNLQTALKFQVALDDIIGEPDTDNGA